MNLRYSEVYPTDDEIDDVLNQCDDIIDSGRSRYWGLKYEDGVKATIEWLLFSPDEFNSSNPME